MVEAGIVEAFASGKVPPEITVDYLMENRDLPAIAALIFLTILTGIIVGARLVSRQFNVRSFGLDDFLAFFSLLLFIAFVILSIILIQLGSGRHIEYIQYVLSESKTNWTESLDFAAHLIYTTALFVCRMSGLAFYLRLCRCHNVLSIAIKVGAVFLTAAYLPQILLIIFHCLPVTSLWPYAWQPKSADYVCLMWGTVYVVNSGLSLACDLLLFTIPIFMIHSLNVSRQKKTQLSFVLLPGVFVIIISIVRLYLVVQGQWLVDGSWFYNPMLAIETAEIGCTLIALSVPGLKPLLGNWLSIFNNSAVPKSHPSKGSLPTIGSIPSRKPWGVTKQGSGVDEDHTSKRTKRRSREIGPGDSDDSLVGSGARARDAIQIRTSLHVDSTSIACSDIKLELYPRNWERK